MIPYTSYLTKFVHYNSFQALSDYKTYSPELNNYNHYSKKIYPYDKVFIKIDYLDDFVKNTLPTINFPIYLISGSSDLTPSESTVKDILKNDNILKYYSTNLPEDYLLIENSTKLKAIPIGFTEPQRIPEKLSFINYMYETDFDLNNKINKILVPSFGDTHPLRKEIQEKIKKYRDHEFFVFMENKPFEEFLQELSKYRYCLCIRGNGIDIHRIYECLLTKTTPLYISDKIPLVYSNPDMNIIQTYHSFENFEKNLENIKDIKVEENLNDIDWEKIRKNILLTNYFKFF